MGRIKNAQIEEESELNNELYSLHEQMHQKKEEFLNLRISRHLDSIRWKMEFLEKRVDELEKNVEHQNIKIVITEKDKIVTKSRIFTLFGVVVGAITAIYYKLRH